MFPLCFCLPRLKLCLHRLRMRTLRILLLVAIVLLNIIFLISLLHNLDKNHLRTQIAPLSDDLYNPAILRSKKILRDMQELDKIRIIVTPQTHTLPAIEQCSDYGGRIPEKNIQETFKWQTVVSGLRESLVFSAYYDPRTEPPTIRIIGVSGGFFSQPERPKKYCQLWYAGDVTPYSSEAEYSIVPETHGRSYAASFHQCYGRVDKIPYAVSLVSDPCDKSPNNILKVTINDATVEPQVNFTVCVTPFNYAYNNVHQLVEMIEVNRLFGAARFTFYNYSTGADVNSYINSYMKDGIASLIPWHVPLAVDVWPADPKVEPEIHYFAQLASLNDCLYRNMFLSRFIVFTDMDELLVPQSHNSWAAMLQNASIRFQRTLLSEGRDIFPGAYLVQNTFFRTDWKNDIRFLNDSWVVNDLQLQTLLKTNREHKINMFYDRSKYIVWSRMATMVSIHSVLDFIDRERVMHAQVPKELALIHHYRTGLDEYDDSEQPRVVNRRLHRFAERIISETSRRHRRVGKRRPISRS